MARFDVDVYLENSFTVTTEAHTEEEAEFEIEEQIRDFLSDLENEFITVPTYLNVVAVKVDDTEIGELTNDL